MVSRPGRRCRERLGWGLIRLSRRVLRSRCAKRRVRGLDMSGRLEQLKNCRFRGTCSRPASSRNRHSAATGQIQTATASVEIRHSKLAIALAGTCHRDSACSTPTVSTGFEEEERTKGWFWPFADGFRTCCDKFDIDDDANRFLENNTPHDLRTVYLRNGRRHTPRTSKKKKHCHFVWDFNYGHVQLQLNTTTGRGFADTSTGLSYLAILIQKTGGNREMDHEPDNEPCRTTYGWQFDGVLGFGRPLLGIAFTLVMVMRWVCVAALVRCSQSVLVWWTGGLLVWIFSKVRGAHGLCCSR